jgi:hypothetical protein
MTDTATAGRLGVNKIDLIAELVGLRFSENMTLFEHDAPLILANKLADATEEEILLMGVAYGLTLAHR